MTTATSATTAPATVRQFQVRASSAPVFGRVLCSARNHHFVVDGPVYNNCPGEEITPPEIFLAAVASCGVELMHVIARDSDVPLQHVAILIEGTVDREKQPRPGVTVFNLVKLDITLRGISREDAKPIVEGFQGRCPIYGTVSMGALKVEVNYEVE